MNADSYYDPSFGVVEWSVDWPCDECEKDTEHDFTMKLGLVTAACTECGSEIEVDPDDWE